MLAINTCSKFTAKVVGVVSVALIVAGCDGLNFSLGRNNEEETTGRRLDQLINVEEGQDRRPLDLGVDQGEQLPLPGSVRPLPPAPNPRVMEQLLFDGIVGNGVSTTNYSLTFSQVELEVLQLTGARGATPNARNALTLPEGRDGQSQPLDLALELTRLQSVGVRTSVR